MANGADWPSKKRDNMILDEHLLREISLLTAAMTGLFTACTLFAPTALSRVLAAFPRQRTAGIVLTAIALLWSAVLLNRMTLGELGKYKDLLYVLTPAAFFLVVIFLDELLAARAFGGLLMLYPTLMVDIARWHPSSWRLVVVTLAYILVIAGMWITLSPYKFRTWTAAMMATRASQVVTGSAFGISTILLLITAFVCG